MKKSLCFAAFTAGTMLAGTGIASAQEAPSPSDRAPVHPHTVAAGESLSKISLAELGSTDRWLEIFALNRSTIASPDLLNVGQVLGIPSAPVAVPAELLASLAPVPPSVPSPSARSATITTRPSTVTTQEVTRSQAVPSSSGGGGNLAAIRACESSGNYAAVSADGLYRGAYQFDRPTWQSVGGSGDPATASAAEQDARAAQLLSQRGSNPWPNCG